MKATSTRTLRIAISLLLVFLAGSLCGHLISTRHYAARVYEHRTIDSGEVFIWPGPSNAIETWVDSNRDGIYEGWECAMWNTSRMPMVAVLVDSEQDGWSEIAGLKYVVDKDVKKELSTAVFDADSNGVYDAFYTGLRINDEKTYEYKDHNLDGRFDVFIDFQKSVSWIFHDSKMLKILEQKDSDKKVLVVERLDGTSAEFGFVDGEWREVEGK